MLSDSSLVNCSQSGRLFYRTAVPPWPDEATVPYLAWLPNSQQLRGLLMASPPSHLLGPRPPLFCRARSRSTNLHSYKRSAAPCPLPRTGRCLLAAAAVEQLLPRPQTTSRRTGVTGRFACRCSYDSENGSPSPPPDKVRAPRDAAVWTSQELVISFRLFSCELR
jgi:hypothetical protein